MNYFDIATWKSPEMLRVIDGILTPLYGAEFIRGVHQSKRNGRQDDEVYFFLWRKPPFIIELSFSKGFDNAIYLNFDHMIDQEDEVWNSVADMIPVPSHIKISDGEARVRVSDSSYSQTANTLAKSLFFLGQPLEDFESFSLTQHEKMEWGLERNEIWKPLWDLRPDCML